MDLDEALCVSRYLVGVDHEVDARTVLHARVGSQLELSGAAWQLLRRFEAARTPRAVLAELGEGARDEVQQTLATLVDAGWLTPADEGEHLFRRGGAIARAYATELLPVAEGLLGARVAGEAAALHVVGVPFDRLAMHPGAAAAPAALRRASQGPLACIDPHTGRHRGIFDHDTGRLLLAGADLLDHGDVAFSLGEACEHSLERITRVARAVGGLGGVPVFIGGDHSITPAIFAGLVRTPTFVVHLDAHTDLDTVFDEEVHHHGSFMERLRRHPLVAGVLQIGVRDLAPPWWRSPDGVAQLGMARVRALSATELCAMVPDRWPCYVTVDVDVLDPSTAPGTGAPVPGGMALPQLEQLLVELALRRELRGVDLVELSPRADVAGTTQLSALRLLVRVLDALGGRGGAAT